MPASFSNMVFTELPDNAENLRNWIVVDAPSRLYTEVLSLLNSPSEFELSILLVEDHFPLEDLSDASQQSGTESTKLTDLQCKDCQSKASDSDLSSKCDDLRVTDLDRDTIYTGSTVVKILMVVIILNITVIGSISFGHILAWITELSLESHLPRMHIARPLLLDMTSSSIQTSDSRSSVCYEETHYCDEASEVVLAEKNILQDSSEKLNQADELSQDIQTSKNMEEMKL
ncbi:hypothetical protein CHUAL_012493 [Chamberlinius hualienensis]